MNARAMMGALASAGLTAAGLVAATSVGGATAVNDMSRGLPPSKIIFTRGQDLFVASSNGSGARRLARRAEHPAVSPDAKRIAFVRKRTLWVMNRNGSGQLRLTSGHEDITPAWSPDGKTIYFSRYIVKKDKDGDFVGYAWAIFSMRSGGSGLRQLTHPVPTDHGTCHFSPAPSPDGQVIAFSVFGDCDHGFDTEISAIDLAGNTVSIGRFDDTGSGSFDPAWSPDGRALAFAAADDFGNSAGIKVARSDGSRAVHAYQKPATDPAWSPDSTWISFVRRIGATRDIWLVRANGTGPRAIVRTTADERDPAWLPAPR